MLRLGHRAGVGCNEGIPILMEGGTRPNRLFRFRLRGLSVGDHTDLANRALFYPRDSARGGERHRERVTGQVYESGILSTGTARVRFDVKFYLIGVFFVVFDLEALFIFTWAVALREVGWFGYCEIAAFIGVLFAGLVYLWRLGALELQTPKQRKQRH